MRVSQLHLPSNQASGFCSKHGTFLQCEGWLLALLLCLFCNTNTTQHVCSCPFSSFSPGVAVFGEQ